MSALVLGLQTIAALDLALFNSHVECLRGIFAQRKALDEQMANTIAHQRRADDLQARLDEAENIARMNGAERDALKADNERLRGEKWDGHLGGGRTRSGEK